MRQAAVFSAGVVLGCMVLLAGGCSRAQPVPSEPVSTPAAVAAAPIQAMSPDQKRSAIATSFPIEVPVASGQFTRARAQGTDAWDYTVLVESTPQEVARWYRTAYGSRQWELVGQSTYGGGGAAGGVALAFRKGNAESQVQIDAQTDAGDPTTVRVTLGVGAPVLQTQ